MTDNTREEKRARLVKYGGTRYQHMFDLDAAYPEVDIFGPQCISAEVRPGWKALLIPVLEVLKQHGCKAGQIKQKFGGLRVYWDFPDHIEAAAAEWRKLNPKHFKNEDGEWVNDPPIPMLEERKMISDAVQPVIAEAECISFLTCEDCGATLDSGGPKSGSTQCGPCSKR
jgi:hypothetical protein